MKWGSVGNLKNKVRKLKHLEKAIRTQCSLNDDIPLVWDKFFCLKEENGNKALYSLSDLLSMNRNEYKNVIDAFFARVYYEIYSQTGITDEIIFDTELLAQLDLSFVANEVDVKKRFRELAKEYHPDTGGDAMKFINLMNIYRKLIEK